MSISPLAQVVLIDHARRPDRLFYDVAVLGSLFRDPDLAQLDRAYGELDSAGFIEFSGKLIDYFNGLRPLYRITRSGREHAAELQGNFV